MTAKKKTTLFHRIFQIVLLFGTVISLFYVPWVLVILWLTPKAATVQLEMDRATEHWFDGMLVYAQQGNEPPVLYASGWKDRAAQVPADPNSLFKIASIGKLFHALSVSHLAHDGRLHLDSSIAHYLPDYSQGLPEPERISVRMLVQHRSGLPNFTDTPGFWSAPSTTAQEALDLIKNHPADFEPGTRYAYCNTNYLLLDLIIAQVAGRPTFEVIQEEILEPLALHRTYESIATAPMDELMSGYYVGVEEDLKTTMYGSMVSSLDDIGRLIRALNDGSAFSPGERELYASLYEFEHTGLIPGYQNIARYDAQHDLVLVQTVSTTNFSGYEWNLGTFEFRRVKKLFLAGKR